MEIEEVAKTNPDAVKKIAIDPATGVDEAKATEIVDESEFPDALRDQAISLVQKLWTVFVEEDATLVEVNPLARLAGDKLEALDGKVSLDENAEFRHEDHESSRTRTRPTRWRPRRRPRASTTSSSTAPSASSATAPGWSCRPSTSSRTPARSTAGSPRRTSSTSVAAPTPR